LTGDSVKLNGDSPTKVTFVNEAIRISGCTFHSNRYFENGS